MSIYTEESERRSKERAGICGHKEWPWTPTQPCKRPAPCGLHAERRNRERAQRPVCKIRWVDCATGKTTEDTNPAVGYARCLGYRVPENPSYRPEPSEWFPICKHHRHVMLNDCLPVERGGRWEFKLLDDC